MDAVASVLTEAWSFLYAYVIPHGDGGADRPFWSFALGALLNMGRSYFWFLLIGMALFAMFVRKRGEPFSLSSGIKWLLPVEIYKKPTVKIDLMMVPISWVLNFVLFAALAIGSGVVQIWLVERLGHTPWTVSVGWQAVALQIVFTLLGTDLARFAWHYQGHKVPFFWEFHKGHHSAEALHPVFIRTHPVDMFIRLAYMNVGGGLLGGGLMYLAGVDASAMAAGWLLVLGVLIHLMQQFEHSHVVLSFGKTLDKIFYPPHFHRIHHSALLEHRDKNLGLTGGLCLWDKLAGTLYVPKPDEHIVYGASLEELGDANPHRTLWTFLSGPFVAAAKTLRRPACETAQPTSSAETVIAR
jgi:sterol desaturase/sphingolipid hydroxylase (fatty acid hydroxylase superfamily)